MRYTVSVLSEVGNLTVEADDSDQAQRRAIKMFSADEYTHMITKSPRGGMTITTKRAWKFNGGSVMTMCVRCNATEGQRRPNGWHLCGDCDEEHKREEFEAMPDVVVVYEYKNGRNWMTKDEWDAKSVRYSPNVVSKAIYKKVEEA